MNITGSIALVTGANRGLGKAYVEALLSAEAAKVYAAARDVTTIKDHPRVVPIRLDVTSGSDIAEAAARCGDVNLLINNAGAMLSSPILAEHSDLAMRKEMEVNVYSVLAMIRAFSPVLAKNGGGAIVNVLSVVSWLTVSANATYCASKHAALSVTDAVRMALKAQSTQVVGVYAGFIDTEMAAGINQPKTPPQQVAERTIEGIVTGKDHVLADARAEEVFKAVRGERP
jgi:NAD(P)-dependent dehydrogenase (short-subunit alcohol dehydrogenase family)